MGNQPSKVKQRIKEPSRVGMINPVIAAYRAWDFWMFTQASALGVHYNLGKHTFQNYLPHRSGELLSNHYFLRTLSLCSFCFVRVFQRYFWVESFDWLRTDPDCRDGETEIHEIRVIRGKNLTLCQP